MVTRVKSKEGSEKFTPNSTKRKMAERSMQQNKPIEMYQNYSVE